jgi:carboxyl-terminal processing protease
MLALARRARGAEADGGGAMKMIPDWAARSLLGAVVVVGLAGCERVPLRGATDPAALAYLTYALDNIEQHGLHSERVDWTAVRRHALDIASGAEIPADTYAAIDYVLTQLPVNGHSSLWSPARVAQENAAIAATLGVTIRYAQRKVLDVRWGSPADHAGLRVDDTIVSVNGAPPEALGAASFFAQIYLGSRVQLELRRRDGQVVTTLLIHDAVGLDALAHARRLPGAIAYISVPSLPGNAVAAYYNGIMEQIIADIDQTPPCGWVVDLQGNPGGYFWPMLAGIGPVLGEGQAGSFTPPGDSLMWSFWYGQALLGDQVMAEARTPYHLRGPDPPVAVLTDGRTGSAGEAIAVAFRGRPQTRSFGAATAGVPTRNVGVPLSDGAQLILTEGMDTDRTGRAYDGPIPPDVAAPVSRILQGTDEDPVLQAGVAWLQQQPACASP